MAHPLEGVIRGPHTIGQERYVRVLIPFAREMCGRASPLELLLPASPGLDYVAILRESPERQQDSAGEKVKIYGPREPSRPPIPATLQNRSITNWLGTLQIDDGSISPIVLEWEGRLGIKASYKLGGSDSTVRTASVNIQSDWVCRSHARHALMLALYVPAVTLDFLTSPIQIVLFLLSAH
jgi:hypothetical protein